METLEISKPYDLSNDGEGLDLIFLGVGSAFAQKNYQTNFVLVKGGTAIFVDFGMTGPNALMDVLGLPVTDIEVVLPTHSHADHVGGFEGIGLMNRYVGIPFMKKPKVKCILSEEYQRILWENSLRGGMEYNERDEDTGQKLDFVDFFEVIRPQWKARSPREIFEVNYGGIRMELFRTKHIPEMSPSWEVSFVSFGLYLPDYRVFISGDTRFDTDLIEMYDDRSDVMFHDVQFFPGAVHAPLDELKTLPVGVTEKMFLMHYADNWKEQDIDQFAGWAQAGKVYRFDEDEF